MSHDFSSELQLNLPKFASTGDSTLDKYLQPLHDAISILAQYLDGRNPINTLTAATAPETTLRTSAINRMVVRANSTIGAGVPVYFSATAGVLEAFPAAATAAATLAMGFCSNWSSVSAGTYGEFTPALGVADVASGLGVGTKLYLANGGGYTNASGTINQPLGVVLTSSKILFMLGIPQ